MKMATLLDLAISDLAHSGVVGLTVIYLELAIVNLNHGPITQPWLPQRYNRTFWPDVCVGVAKLVICVL
jgi:hypothetical protein